MTGTALARQRGVRTPEERFWSYVDMAGPIPDPSPGLSNCWLWTGYQDRRGYGRFYIKGRAAHGILAHQFLAGRPPAGLESDHLCRVPACVRPQHIEFVSHHENVLRGDAGLHLRDRKACPQGHPYDAANTHIYQGRRYCRACDRARNREKHRRRKRGGDASVFAIGEEVTKGP